MLDKAIVFLTKEPIIGRVKTRLGQKIGFEQACAVHEILLRWCIQSVQKLPHPICISLDGNIEGSFAKFFKDQGIQVFAQNQGDLGSRIHQSMQIAKRVALLGTDTPHFQSQYIDCALQNSDITIGPAKDGGYWLLAANQPEKSLFQDIPWSTEKVLEKTLANLQHNRLEYSFLPTLQDIDTQDDLWDLLASPSFPPILKERLKNYA